MTLWVVQYVSRFMENLKTSFPKNNSKLIFYLNSQARPPPPQTILLQFKKGETQNNKLSGDSEQSWSFIFG